MIKVPDCTDGDVIFFAPSKPIEGLSVRFITPPPPGPFSQKYGGSMPHATVDLKVYPQTREALRAVAALKNKTMAATLEWLVNREYQRILGPTVKHARKTRAARRG